MVQMDCYQPKEPSRLKEKLANKSKYFYNNSLQAGKK